MQDALIHVLLHNPVIGWGGKNKPIHIEKISASCGSAVVFRYSADEQQGWDELDPTWRGAVRKRLAILFGSE